MIAVTVEGLGTFQVPQIGFSIRAPHIRLLQPTESQAQHKLFPIFYSWITDFELPSSVRLPRRLRVLGLRFSAILEGVRYDGYIKLKGRRGYHKGVGPLTRTEVAKGG